MTEGSLQAPTRHPIDWRNPDFYDEEKLDEEFRRVFDICHGCRRCFNLCDSFPRLFDLIDESKTGELDSVDSEGFGPVVEACTLCDMCFMTKCPYVPPHEFDLDFPHLMLRARAVELKKGEVPFTQKQLTETDRNGKLAAPVAGLANWASREGNALTRPVLEMVAGVDRNAALPKFHGQTFETRARRNPVEVNKDAPAYGRKAVIYATCFSNYNNPEIGMATRAVLARNGVETEVVYPVCCGMPKLEHGDFEEVARRAEKVAAEMKPWIEKGYEVIALVPSCALMLKFEWPLIVPENEDVKLLSANTRDVAEYIVDISKREGLAPGMQPLDGGVTVHISCHSRAQNMGQKATEMLRLLPEADVTPIERCSGHGGSWGVLKENFEIALKVGKPVARQTAKAGKKYLCAECPLAGDHIRQGLDRLEDNTLEIDQSRHPVQLMAQSYGLI
ncbi:MAG: heterodisulfide reductase-related iron-sulfur binding cluster [Alphaproteobacteria bacterium]